MDTPHRFSTIPSATDASQETIISNMVDTKPYEKSLRNARIWLYVIAAAQVLVAVYEYTTVYDKEIALAAGLIDIVVALVFFVLALFSRKNPFVCFVTALVVYVVIQIASMVMNPSNISGFFILKIIIIVALVKAIKAAQALKKIKESIGDMPS